MIDPIEFEMFDALSGRTLMRCGGAGDGRTVALTFRGARLVTTLSESQARAIAEWYRTEYGQLGYSQFLSMPSKDRDDATLTLLRRDGRLAVALSDWDPEALNPRQHREVWLDIEQTLQFVGWFGATRIRTEVTR
jgi:hypothetical protein